MKNSDKSKNNKPAITEEDIDSYNVGRRSFLKGLGIFAGISAIGLSASSCKDDPVTPESDIPDADENDSFDLD